MKFAFDQEERMWEKDKMLFTSILQGEEKTKIIFNFLVCGHSYLQINYCKTKFLVFYSILNATIKEHTQDIF